MRGLCLTLLKGRWLVLALALLLSLGAAVLATGLRFSFSFTQFFPQRQAPQVERYFQFMQRFGRDDGLVFVALEDPQKGLLSGPGLRHIAELRQALAGLGGVSRVEAITHLRLPRASEAGIAAEPLVSNADLAATATGQHLRALLRQDPFARQLVDPSGGAAALLVELDSRDPSQREVSSQGQVLDEIRARTLAQLKGSALRPHFAGVPVVRAGYIALLAGEIWRLVLLAGLILALVLFALFRTWRAVLLPLVTVGISTLMSVALLVAADQPFTLMSTLIPMLVMILGVADSVHFLARFQEERLRGLDLRAAIVSSFSHLAVACFLTSLTTAVGFAALQVSAIDIVADFGLYAALGVMVAYLVTILLLPPLLLTFPLPLDRSLVAMAKQPSGKFLAWHFKLASHHSRRISVGFVLLSLVLLLVSYKTLSRRAFFVDDLPKDHALVMDTRFVENHFGGILPLDLEIEGDAPLADDPRALALAIQLSELLRAQPELGPVLSYSDAMQALSLAAAGDSSLLQSRQGLAQLRLLADSGDSEVMQRLVSGDERALRISTRVGDLGTPKMESLLARIDQQARALVKDLPFRVGLNGFTPAALWVNRYMVRQLFYGFGLAFALITLIFLLLFRSVKMALVALLPNLFPLVGVLAWMSLTGIALKPTTAIIFSVAFGLGVDNNIHFLTRYRDELRSFGDRRRALGRTMAGSGRGILFSSLVLSLGFVAALFAQLGTSRDFAILTIVTIFGALIAVLVLLPALLLLGRSELHPATNPRTPNNQKKITSTDRVR